MTSAVKPQPLQASPSQLFVRGLFATWPIGLGYVAVAIAFGLFAVGKGYAPLTATLVSLSNFSSAGQFTGLEILSQYGSYFELLVAVLVVNLRYTLMSLALTQRFDRLSLGQKLILGHGIGDEVFAMALQWNGPIPFAYFLGMNVFPLLGWTTGTALGAFVGAVLPSSLVTALGLAIYCMFIAIVVPNARQDKGIFKACVLALLLSLLFAYTPFLSAIPFGWRVILVTLIAASAMAVYDVKGNRDLVSMEELQEAYEEGRLSESAIDELEVSAP